MWCRLVRRHGDRPDDRPPVIARASAAESGGHHAGWGYELSLRISAKSAATKSCLAVNRSTMRIGGATTRTRPRPRDGGGRRGRWRRRHREDRSTRREIGGATARGEQPEVADADEAFREHVQQEAPEKIVDVERQRPDLTPVSVVLLPKRDGLVRHGDEPVIRDGDAVGVARQVVQHVGGTAKGRLRVDHPRLAMQRSEPGAKRRLGGQRL